jgi:acyl-CoA hydrolase
MEQNSLTLRFLVEPNVVNFGGKAHGGAVMKWIDQAGYACAVGWSKHYCVTVYVGGIRFLNPIFIGDLVEVRASVIYTGSTSLHLSIDVFSQNPKDIHWVQNTHCIVVFVAMDDQGKPTPVPQFTPQTEEEKRKEKYAIRLMELRKSIESEMGAFWVTN